MASSKEDGARSLTSKLASFTINRGASSSEGQQALQRTKTLLRRRSAVSAEVTSLQEVDAFKPKVIDAVEEVKYNAGDIIIKQGDPGDQFYLLEEGTCEVWLPQPDNPEPQMVKEYSAGDSFGELALLYNAPRAATVKASTNCVLWAMDRMTFRTILLHTTSNKRKLYEKFLEDVPLLKTLDKYERSAIADVLETEYFEEGQEILVEGQPGDKFYILEEVLFRNPYSTHVKLNSQLLRHNIHWYKINRYSVQQTETT